SGPADGGGGPTEAGADLVDRDLDRRAALALLVLPAALAQASEDDHSGALGERLCSVLGLVTPQGPGEEVGVLHPLAGTVAVPLVHGEADPRHRDTRRGEPELRILDQIAYQSHAVAHCDPFSPFEFGVLLTTPTVDAPKGSATF